MKVISSLIVLFSLACCSQPKPKPFLCLESSSIWYSKASNQFLLSATNCHEPDYYYFLSSHGKVFNKDKIPDAMEVSMTPLFKSELSIQTNLQFLRPFMNFISWGSLRNDGAVLDHTNLAHFPMEFWQLVPPLEVAQLLANVPDTTELVNFIKWLKSNNVPVYNFVISTPASMKAYCHGPTERSMCYPGDSIVVFSSTAKATLDSLMGIIRQETNIPTYLWRKLFENYDLVEPEQPLYIHGKVH